MNFLLAYLLNGCCVAPEKNDNSQKGTDVCTWSKPMTLTQQDLKKNEFPKFNDIFELNHSYLVCGDGKNKPPVILLHEILGLDAKTIDYVKALAQHFTVYVPLLMGKEDGNGISFLHGFFNYTLKSEWEQQDKLNNSMLVTQWLRKFVKEVEIRHSNQNIGIIGNCLTGALPLALLDNERITGIVLAQPTLPIKTKFGFGDKEELVISSSEWKIAKERLNQVKYPSKLPPAKTYVTRFGLDTISPIEKYEYLARELGSGFLGHQITKAEYTYKDKNGQLVEIPHCAHSSLIHDWQDDYNHPSEKRRNEIIKFLTNPLSSE